MEQMGLFPDAKFRLPRPIEPIMREADVDGDYRTILIRRWGGGPCIAWVGLNPSHADASRDDMTVTREMRWSMAWGFGSMVKMNIYPFRSPTTYKLWAWLKKRNTGDREVMDAYLANIYAAPDALRECTMFMAAWGNGAAPEDVDAFLESADETFADYDRWVSDKNYEPPRLTWHCLGTTSSGAPIHTSSRGKHRVPDDVKPIVWRAGS